MKARFASKCAECGTDIKVGKEIQKNSVGKWVHEACADTQNELP